METNTKIQVTAREINEVAIDLSQRTGFQQLAKSFAKMAITAAVENKGIAFVDKDSSLYQEIKQNRRLALAVA